jgi:hypothetical protein
MTDISQTSLVEAPQVDWENYGKTSSYVAPPPALGQDGKAITYYGIGEAKEDKPTKEGFLQFLIDPIKIVRSGTADGYVLRFTRASVKPFSKRDANGEMVPIKGNPNALANFLRACGLSAKPQVNADYRAAVQACKGKAFPFTIDWEAYNKDTGESVKGYRSFPDDPFRPGSKKSILKAGDVITEYDAKGNQTGVRVVQSEVLFANARLKFFQDPTKGVK